MTGYESVTLPPRTGGLVDEEFIDIVTRELDELVREEFDELVSTVWDEDGPGGPGAEPPSPKPPDGRRPWTWAGPALRLPAHRIPDLTAPRTPPAFSQRAPPGHERCPPPQAASADGEGSLPAIAQAVEGG